MPRLLPIVATVLFIGAAGCSSELGEPCTQAGQCPEKTVCRNNLYLKDLCEEGIVPVEGSGPEGYCTLVCDTDEDCADIPKSDGCVHDPRSDRKLCMPDCSAYK